jgi:hypothetical protein
LQLTKLLGVHSLAFWHKARMPDKHEPMLLTDAPLAPPTGDDYRDLAGKIREVGPPEAFASAPARADPARDQLRRRADHIERRTRS